MRHGNIAAGQTIHAAAQEQDTQYKDIDGGRTRQAGQVMPDQFGKSQQQETNERTSHAKQQNQPASKAIRKTPHQWCTHQGSSCI